MMIKFRLQLIGPFGLFKPDGARIEISSKKCIALIALLATAANGERARRWLQTMLWGTREEEQARASLRRELSNLSRILEAEGAGNLLTRSIQRVGFATSQAAIDVFEIGVSPASSALVQGDFLEGLDLRDCEEFEDWLRIERERVRVLQQVNIPAPVNAPPGAYEILGMNLPGTAALIEGSPPKLPPKPSLAVVPFQELGQNPTGWIGPGIADELGVILSQFPQLFIVASSSARALAGQILSRAEIARQLGVRYLLEGTVIVLEEQIRVSVSLVAGLTGEQVWAETFHGKVADLFAVQSEIANAIAPRIWTKVDHSERQRVLRLSGPASGKYEAYWRANALFRSWEKAAVEEAVELAEQLATDDPTCPWAASLAAFCHSIIYLLGYSSDRDVSLRRAVLHYQAALRYGEDNVEALGYAAGTLLNIGGDLHLADKLVAHSLSLLPAHQPTLFWGGWVDIARGEPERARERFVLALRINPASGVRGQSLCGMGIASLQLGQFEEAYELLAEASVIAAEFPPAKLGFAVAAKLAGREVPRGLTAQIPASELAAFAMLLRRPEDQTLFAQALLQPN